MECGIPGETLVGFQTLSYKCLGTNSSPSGSNNFPSPQYPLVKDREAIRKNDYDGGNLSTFAVYISIYRSVMM